MDATTMRSIVAHLAELRRDREYHRAAQFAPRNPKEDAVHNRSQGDFSGDGGFNTDSTGQDRDNL